MGRGAMLEKTDSWRLFEAVAGPGVFVKGRPISSHTTKRAAERDAKKRGFGFLVLVTA